MPGPTLESPTPIAIAVVEYRRKFLIGLRPDGVPLAGYWEFPGGKIKPGETPEQAAARECIEETGLAVHVGAPYPKVVHQYEHSRVAMHFFACEAVNPEQPLPARFRWAPLEQLSEYRFPPANVELIARLSARSGSPSEAAVRFAARRDC